MFKDLAYLKMILLIGLVSAYDTALTAVYSETIWEMEQNPVGKWLLSQGGVPLFIEIKAFMTLCVVVFCMFLTRTKYKVTIIGVCLFQLWLFYWLTFSGRKLAGQEHVVNPLIAVVHFYLYGTCQ